MARSAGACPHCSERLSIGTNGLFLNEAKKAVSDWRQAKWKTCPKCSMLEGAHVFLPFPSAFGKTGLRTLNGVQVPQSDCTHHRQDDQAGVRDPKQGGLRCSQRGLVPLQHAEDEPEWTADELSEPQDCPGCGAVTYADAFCDDACREQYLKGEGRISLEEGPEPELVEAWLRDRISEKHPEEEPEAEEGAQTRRLVVHRSREARLRETKLSQAREEDCGRLRCQVPGCGFDFEEIYGELGAGYAHVHHVEALAARGAPSKTRLSDLAVLCANCHAMVHRGGETRPLKGLIRKASGR